MESLRLANGQTLKVDDQVAFINKQNPTYRQSGDEIKIKLPTQAILVGTIRSIREVVPGWAEFDGLYAVLIYSNGKEYDVDAEDCVRTDQQVQ